MKNIGVLTSGGDCGGLNGVIKGAALTAIANGMKCFVIPNGYAGLYNLVEFDKLTELTADRLDKFDANLAGSEAGHSRVKIKKINDDNKYQRIKDGLKKFNIDGLVISGGDDSGSVMSIFFSRELNASMRLKPWTLIYRPIRWVETRQSTGSLNLPWI